MNTFSLIMYSITTLWFLGGLAVLTWLKWYAIKQKSQSLKRDTIKGFRKTLEALYSGKKLLAENRAGLGLFAPYLIPIIVTAICLIVG